MFLAASQRQKNYLGTILKLKLQKGFLNLSSGICNFFIKNESIPINPSVIQGVQGYRKKNFFYFIFISNNLIMPGANKFWSFNPTIQIIY